MTGVQTCALPISYLNKISEIAREARGELLERTDRQGILLTNPGLGGRLQITNTIRCAVAIYNPGDIAPAHIHSPNASRTILSDKGGYTNVEGERCECRRGDIVFTPNGTWHDHGNIGSEPVVWLDGLDIPMVAFFDSGFMQRYPQASQPVSRAEGDSAARYGSLLMPVGYTPPSLTSPVFCYPYAKTRAALDQLRRDTALHPCHGVKMQYTNPATGGHAMPTMGAFIQWLPAGFRGAPYRATDATVYCAVEGRGVTHIGDQTFEWQAHDVFVAPSWSTVWHEAATDAVLFSFSDRPAQQALGLWREEAPFRDVA